MAENIDEDIEIFRKFFLWSICVCVCVCILIFGWIGIYSSLHSLRFVIEIENDTENSFPIDYSTVSYNIVSKSESNKNHLKFKSMFVFVILLPLLLLLSLIWTGNKYTLRLLCLQIGKRLRQKFIHIGPPKKRQKKQQKQTKLKEHFLSVQ